MDNLSEAQRFQVESLSREQRANYDRLRAGGETHNFALMFASSRFPGFKSRDNRWSLSRDAKRMNVRGVRGKYQPALARFPGDPKAFCESMGDVKRRADQLSAETGVEHRVTDRPQNAETGRQDLLRRARRGEKAANARLDRELEVA